jgi:hypothetical protein
MIAEAVKKEMKRNPNVLFPYGGIKKSVLLGELSKYPFKFPSELMKFWIEFGGGDFFEVETLLSPLPTSDNRKENVIDINKYYQEKGLNKKYFVFETNNALITAFDVETHQIVIMEDDDFLTRKRFDNINAWFAYFWKVNQ